MDAKARTVSVPLLPLYVLQQLTVPCVPMVNAARHQERAGPPVPPAM